MMTFKQIKEKLSGHFNKLAQPHTSAQSIALGFSLASLIAILPTPGISILICLFLILIFPKLNKISMFAGLAFWNPFVQIPIYTFSYSIGNAIFGSDPVVKYELELVNLAFDYSRRYLIGNMILAVAISISCYLLIYLILSFLRRKKD